MCSNGIKSPVLKSIKSIISVFDVMSSQKDKLALIIFKKCSDIWRAIQGLTPHAMNYSWSLVTNICKHPDIKCTGGVI